MTRGGKRHSPGPSNAGRPAKGGKRASIRLPDELWAWLDDPAGGQTFGDRGEAIIFAVDYLKHAHTNASKGLPHDPA